MKYSAGFRPLFCAIPLSIFIILVHPGDAFTREPAWPHGTFTKDLGYILSSPFRMNRDDGLKLAALTGVTTGLIVTLDGPIRERYGVRHSAFPAGLPQKVSRLGDVYNIWPYNLFILTGHSGLTLAAVAAGNRKLLDTSGIMLESMLITKLITQSAKIVIGRTRPYTGGGPGRFHPFRFRMARQNKSMPSGHSSTIFALMTVLAKRHDTLWVTVPAYTFASSVAFQRIESDNHWFSDVIVGGVLGHTIAGALVDRHNDRQSSSSAGTPAGKRNSVERIFNITIMFY